MKWSWAGHINRLKDGRWTSHATTWSLYDKKRRQGRPAKRWRDDLDKYWSDTIWQRTAQDRLNWRGHANDDDDDDDDYDVYCDNKHFDDVRNCDHIRDIQSNIRIPRDGTVF